MSWDYEELRKLSKKKGSPDSTVYQNALQWKLWRADYHAERAQMVWSELDQLVEKKGRIVVGKQERKVACPHFCQICSAFLA